MKQLTRWHPDTCECIVDYEWDDALPDDKRTHTVVNIVRACSAHSGKSAAQLHKILFDENPRKNRMMAKATEKFPEESLSWHYDDKRVLHLSVKGIDAANKNSLQFEANDLFGSGKVVVE